MITHQEVASALADVERGRKQGHYDTAAAYTLLREKLHQMMYGERVEWVLGQAEMPSVPEGGEYNDHGNIL